MHVYTSSTPIAGRDDARTGITEEFLTQEQTRWTLVFNRAQTAKVEVAGSNPVSRSQIQQLRGRHWRFFSFLRLTCIYVQLAFELFEISVEFHCELDVRVSHLL
jgi:hypothetical protein